jgi:hypothetical protein
MATIKTCDRCGKALKGKRYFCGYLNPFGDDYAIEESIHVDLCGDCYDKFKKYFLKMLYASEEFIEVNQPIFENDISEWQKDKIKEALNGNNKNL